MLINSALFKYAGLINLFTGTILLRFLGSAFSAASGRLSGQFDQKTDSSVA